MNGKDGPFYRRAALMVRMIPQVAEEACFALKGGTAINFFVRDLQRMSIDIDLTYLPIEERTASLDGIAAALDRIADRITRLHPEVRVHRATRPHATRTVKLVVQGSTAQVKIEPNEVMRGVIFPSEMRNLSPKAEALFEMAAAINTVSLPDLYAGKLCAALDRQHPRDLFDVKVLLENEGITEKIRKAFVVYLASHDRPIHEVIDPPRHDRRALFENEFAGMTTVPVTYDELVAAREKCIVTINTEMTEEERRFLVSVKEGAPKWELLGLPGIEALPAIRWKVANIVRMDRAKRADMLAKLRAKLRLTSGG
jgi:predicted nucleotidyltransferase component of viral defense system